jgi:hypothetical protein
MICLQDIGDLTAQPLPAGCARAWRTDTSHAFCEKHLPPLLVSLRSRMGQVPFLQIEACCLRDYGGLILALQNVLLYLDLKKQLSLAAAGASRGEGTAQMKDGGVMMEAYRAMPVYRAVKEGLQRSAEVLY